MRKFYLISLTLFFISFLSYSQGSPSSSQDPKYSQAEGEEKFNDEQYSEAVELFSIALKTDQKNGYIYYLRGMSKYFLEDFEGAIADFTKALEFSPEDKNSFWSYKGHFRKVGNDYTYSPLGMSLKHKYYHIYFYRGNAKTYLEDYRGAISDFNKYVIYDNTDANVFAQRGTCKVHLKDYQNAMLDLTKAISIDNTNSQFFYNRAETYIMLKQTNKACIDLSRAGELGLAEAYELIKRFCK
jgi:tetratricopeptide (TPR) repeat protein